jgi:hypothetical protein
MSAPEAEFRDQADPGVEAPQAQDIMQNDYKSRTGQSHIPVIGDNAPVEDNIGSRESANSDAQLGNQSLFWIFNPDHPANILQHKMMPMPLISVALLVPALVELSLLVVTPSQAMRKALGDGTDGRSRVAGGPSSGV